MYYCTVSDSIIQDVIFLQFRTDLLEHSHDQQKKVLMSPDELTELLNFYHSTPVCGYSSVSTTLAKILQDYTWNGVKDVVEYVSKS